jgi:NAD/NADP transhydrogenase beta subunit
MLDKKRNTEERLAELLDNKFRIPGTNIRFGIDPIIGLIPGAGDVVAGVISLYFLIQAAMLGGSASVLGRMSLNILLDVLIGSIPVLGEAFDVYWKANLRNARLLEELQQHPQKTTSESRLWIWFVVIQIVAVTIGIILLVGWVITELIELVF